MSRDDLSDLPAHVATFHRRARRTMKVAGVLLVYLLLLGPFWAVDGPHDVVSEPVRKVVWWPAQVVYQIPLFGELIDDYLDLWWIDPNVTDTTR